MFGKQAKAGGTNQIDSLIGKGTRVEGNVHFSGGLRVDGEIIGKVEGDPGVSTLVLSEQARIEGEVNVAHLIVNGNIVGPARVLEFLEMQAKARIVGDVEYRMIEMHQGAVVEGRLIHRPKEPTVEKTD